MIFTELSNVYQNLKTALPTSNIELMFMIKDKKGVLADMLQNLYISIPEKEFKELKIFDNFTLVSNTKGVLIPVAYKKRANPVLNRNGIKKITNYIEA